MDFSGLFDSLGELLLAIFLIAAALYVLRIVLLAGTFLAVMLGLIFISRKRKKTATVWLSVAAFCLVGYLLLSILVFQQLWF